MNGRNAIAAHALTKRYRDTTAVRSLDLDVRQGEVYGFLGRNGAGKTTTIRMLLGLVQPTEGTVEVLGTRIRPGVTVVFARVGHLVEVATAYPNLTVRENLAIAQRLTRAPRAAVGETIDMLRLSPVADRCAGTLSLGNKQRLSLARALLHRPELLVLDEPGNALDPAGIVEVRDMLRSLARERGATVFMSSHILAEVAHVADRIDRGAEAECDHVSLGERPGIGAQLPLDDVAHAAGMYIFNRVFDGDYAPPDVAVEVLNHRRQGG